MRERISSSELHPLEGADESVAPAQTAALQIEAYTLIVRMAVLSSEVDVAVLTVQSTCLASRIRSRNSASEIETARAHAINISNVVQFATRRA